MKKSLLFLSMLAVAGSAAAFDTPVAGTATAPNYYVIKANRGDARYLAYGTPTTTSLVETMLHRTTDLTEANIWAITPGTAEGSVVIKNYSANAYLLDYVSKQGNTSTLEVNAVAVTVGAATDVFLEDLENGAFSINLVKEPAAGEYASLDATTGSDLLGNWIPNDGGTTWWFTQVDLSKGVDAAIAAAEEAIAQSEAGPLAKQYVGYLTTYKEVVPQVAAELQAGIDKLNAYQFAADYATAIPAIYQEAMAAANTALGTVLNGKVYAIRNQRRVVTAATAGAFLAVGDGVYVPATTYAAENSHFTFKTSGDKGGYIIFNEATSTYLSFNESTNRDVPVAEEASATVVYPFINSNGGYDGIAFSFAETKDGMGLNWHSTKDEEITQWSVDDGGSIWALVDCDPQAAVDELAATYAESYAKYIAAVPAVKEILDKAVADIKALTASATVGEEAAAIDAKAIEDANALLATCYDGKRLAIHSLRQNDYLAYADEAYGHSTDAEAAGVCFEFKAVEGGYVLRNEAAGKYVAIPGELTAEDVNGENAMTVVDDEAAAVKVTPVLYNNAGFFGVALYLGDVTEGEEGAEKEYPVGMNQNGNPGLWIYYIADGGSIWGLTEFTGAAINEISVAKSAMEGIYDLQGRKLATPVKGINIINGVKVLVK